MISEEILFLIHKVDVIGKLTHASLYCWLKQIVAVMVIRSSASISRVPKMKSISSVVEKSNEAVDFYAVSTL